MSLFNHKERQNICKGIILLLYLGLFGSQLSHKFYICANFSSRLFKHAHSKIVHTKLSIHSSFSLVDHQRNSFLSLDKRYESKPIFGLIAPSIQLSVDFIVIRSEYGPGYSNYNYADPASLSLRGPPSMTV